MNKKARLIADYFTNLKKIKRRKMKIYFNPLLAAVAYDTVHSEIKKENNNFLR